MSSPVLSARPTRLDEAGLSPAVERSAGQAFLAIPELAWVATDDTLTQQVRCVRYHRRMPDVLTRLRSKLRRSPSRDEAACETGAACSWDVMRATYEEQAARGVPEAIRGLELIEQDRWPTSGQPRER